MTVKLLTEHHLEFLSLKEGCRGLSECTFVKMSNCWKSHAAAHMISMKIGKFDAFCNPEIQIWIQNRIYPCSARKV